MRKEWLWCVPLVVAVSLSSPARGVVIDFESFSNGQPLGAVVTSGNTVTFAVGAGAPAGPAVVADVGTPTTAFSPEDTPTGAGAGAFFLTTGGFASMTPLDYFITFENPVANLSLDVYDLVTDAKATLTVFSDSGFTTSVGSTMVTPSEVGDFTIAVLNPSADILSASLVFTPGDFGSDYGTGIDNVTFTMPEPGATCCAALALAALWASRRRRSAGGMP